MMRGWFSLCLGAFSLGGLLLLPSPAMAQTEIFGLELEGEIEAGGRGFPVRPSESDRGKFEEYRDMPRGPFLENLDLRLRTKDDRYLFELRAREAGEKDQNYLFRSSRLGLWEFGFEWDQIPHVFSNTGRSLYTETRRGVFELPDSIQTALGGTTNAATQSSLLQGFLAGAQPVDLRLRWDIARLLLKVTPTPDWDLGAEYTRTRKEGNRPISALTGFGIELPEPIEQTVHDVSLTAGWAREWWQLQLGYNLSLFHNDVDVMVWDYPGFAGTGFPPTFSQGRHDLAPDNSAHTMSLTGGVNLPLRSRLTGTFSYGLRFQNDSFIPHTINPAISNPGLALPADNLDGEVHIRHLKLQLTSHPLRDISVAARYRLYDFDDRSRNLTFPAFVDTDFTLRATAPNAPIRSSRFSYTKHNAGVDVGWRLLTPLSLKVGYEWERWDRDEHQRETPRTDEHTPKVSLDYTPFDWLLLRTSYGHSWRRLNEYNTFAHLQHALTPGSLAILLPGGPAVTSGGKSQSPLLRKYDEANRDRDRVDFLVQLTPLDTLTFTPTLSFRDDNYKDSFFGLQDDRSWSAGIDVSWNPIERVTLFASYMREEFFARMRSRYRLDGGAPTDIARDNPTYDWVARNEDGVNTFGVGIDVALIPKKLDFRLDWNYSRATGKMRAFNPVTPTGGTATQNATATAVDFPNITDSLHQIEASLRYQLYKGWFAKIGYVFEKFNISDFRTDNIQPFMGTVDPANARRDIFLGAQIRPYTAHIAIFTLGYRF